MTKDDELEQLRAEKTILCERLRCKDEELQQSHRANQDLREGLKEAIMALESQQEQVKALEGLIDSLQERVKTLEGQQPKIARIAVYLPLPIGLLVLPRACAVRAGNRLEARCAIVSIACDRWR